MTRWLRRAILVGLAGLSVATLSTFARAAQADEVADALRLLSEQRIEEATPIVARLHTQKPTGLTQFLDGEIEFAAGQYAAAHDSLVAALKSPADLGPLEDEAKELADLAARTDLVTRGFAEKRSAHFIIRYAPADALLVGYALTTLESAYAAIGDDLGYRPPAPVRVEIYGEVADLARVSPLTEKEIETSGTIALCKFNRLMIVSPRALLAGYPWRDTLNHEYTHFVISRASYENVPIWLHEGLAKFAEQRWRRGPGNDGGLTPTMEHLLATGLARHHLITFEQMHPSMAKLPSQEDAALAFAEVYEAVHYLHGKFGMAGLRGLIIGLRDTHDLSKAVTRVTGRSFAEFQSDWRSWLSAQSLHTHPGLLPAHLRFKKGQKGADEDADDDGGQTQAIAEDKARKWARLGGLLRGHHHLPAAALEYERAAKLVGPANLLVANRLARTYLEMGQPERAIAVVEPTLLLYPDQAAPHALAGEALLAKGDFAGARAHFEAEIGISPFDPAAHCGLSTVYAQLGDARKDDEHATCQALK